MHGTVRIWSCLVVHEMLTNTIGHDGRLSGTRCCVRSGPIFKHSRLYTQVRVELLFAARM